MQTLHPNVPAGCGRFSRPSAPCQQQIPPLCMNRSSAPPSAPRSVSQQQCSKSWRCIHSSNASRARSLPATAATSQTTIPLSAPTAPADPCLNLSGVEGKAVGAMLGSMCGNALGAQVEPEKHYRIARLFPNGLQDLSWSFDISPDPLPAGYVTGDYVTMLAVALSLARSKGADTFDIINCLASSFMQNLIPGNVLRYSPYTELALESLAAGTNPFMLAHHVEGYMAVTPSRASQSCSHRPDRQLHGITDFTAVVRAVPVGIAYRDASDEALAAAVDAAVLVTHPSEQGREGAAVIAAAVAWLMRADPAVATPQQLLTYLSQFSSHSADMTAKLQLLQQRLPRLENLGEITNWSHFWASPDWSHFTGTANLLWKQNLAVQGTQAAAVALWVALVSWRYPKQAVMLAASLGGYAGTTGALVGALLGALHGCHWVPKPWWDTLLGQLLDEDGFTEYERRALESEIEALSHKGRGGSLNPSPRGSFDQGLGQGLDAAAAQNDMSSDSDADVSPEEAQVAAAEAAEAAAAVAAAAEGEGEADEAEESQEVDPLSELRVGKYAVVMLGHELAKLSCTEAPQLLR